jgi:glycosyltransferase involved in cell wall biosynthesis
MSITVTYDTQIFRLQRQGGISRYFTELVGAYRHDPGLGVDPQLPARVVAARHLKDAELGRRIVVPRALTRAWNLLPAGPRRHQAADLVHHTYYLQRELHAAWTVPRVTTIHDMIPELFPEHFPRGNPHQAKRAYVEQSHGLLFVSETSRRDLLRLYGPQDVPMAVAPLAPGAAFSPRQERTSLDPYVVFVGKRGGYKEFDTLLAALDHTPGLSLVAVGGGALEAGEQLRLKELGLESRVTQISVPDVRLAALYSFAVALVVPSRYEGFGLPVVEAMACGCPVVVSDIEVFHEVADEAAEYFPAGDASALAAALERIRGDEALRRSRRQSGLLRVRDFTWERTAAVTAGLYREVLSGSPDRTSFTRSAQGG